MKCRHCTQRPHRPAYEPIRPVRATWGDAGTLGPFLLLALTLVGAA